MKFLLFFVSLTAATNAATTLNNTFTVSTAILDLHPAIPSSGPVTGTYQPDARNVDPASALDTSPRSAFLGSFAGLDPNGDWTFFIADTSPGGTAVLQSWNLTITGVPEPTPGVLLVGSTLLLLTRRR